MPEIIQLGEALRKGIQPDSRLGVNTPFLERCVNLRATEWGLRNFNPITELVDEYTGVDWPYNYLFRGKKHTLFGENGRIFSVDESDWSGTEIIPKNLFLRGNNQSLVGLGQWHHVDFHDFWMLLSDGCMVIGFDASTAYATAVRIPKTGCNHKDGRVLLGGFPDNDFWWSGVPNIEAWVAAQFSNVSVYLDEHLSDGNFGNWIHWSSIGEADFLGLWLLEYLYHGNICWEDQITNGTFTGSATGWTLGTGWAYSSNKITHTAGNVAPAYQSNRVEDGMYYYYSITVSGRTAGSVVLATGGTAMTSALATNATHTGYFLGAATGHLQITPTTDFDGSVDSVQLILLSRNIGFNRDSPYHRVLAKRNESGMMPLPVRGTVQKMLPMGDAVICYTDSGIAAAVSYSSPVSTYGVREINNLSHIGIAGRGAAGGGEQGHLFLDEGGALWGVSPDLTAERIGYQNKLAEFVGNYPTIEYDGQHQEWYISARVDNDDDLDACYVFTRNGGLSKAPWAPSSVSFASGEVVTGHLWAATDPDTVYVTTGRIRGGGSPRDITNITHITLVTQDTDTTGWTVYVDYKMDVGDAWTASEAFVSDARGHVHCKVSGIEFRIRLTHPDRTKADLDDIIIELNDGERRSVGRLLP